MKKSAQTDANTACCHGAGCSKAEPKFFNPPQTPSRGCRMTKI